ncbi:MAG TPA: carbamate kinase [Thermodesulfobacteriota bacterium]|nr:carbamate kinase [Thermodesulfobacteriota bacterium]
MKVAVVAFGGNALMDFSGKSSYAEQIVKAEQMCGEILSLFDLNYQVLITHGNGPQVGNLLMQQECLAGTIPPMPLDVCGAMTQGQMGYMIEQTLRNMLTKNGMKKSVVSLVTQVVVSGDDPAFRNPTKFIGPFFKKEEGAALEKERGWQIKEDSGRGWRRLVPSPKPIDIVEKDEIREMVKKNFIVIACGGGGIPVLRDKKGRLKGVAAVIDKDFAAERLGSLIGAEILILITSVKQVSVFYGTPRQKNFRKMTLKEAEQYYADGHFPPGSMGPKIEASMKFLRSGGKKTIITSLEGIGAAIKGEGGTEIVP